MMPSSVLPIMASLEYFTIAVMSCAFLTACLCFVTSATAVITSRTSPVSMWDKLMFTGNSVPSRQLQIQTSGPSPGVCEVVLPVLGVDLPQRLGHQRLDGPADQLVAVIAEQRFGLAIDKPDHALLVHPHQGIRHSLQQALEPRHVREHLIPLSSVAENSKQTKHKT